MYFLLNCRFSIYSNIQPYSDLENFHALTETLEAYDQGTSARLFLHGNVFGAAVKSMGTDRHKDLIQKTENNEVNFKENSIQN